MIDSVKSINEWVFNSLEKNFKSNGYSEFCLAYVSSLIEEYSKKDINKSVVIYCENVIDKPSFEKYQSLGDICFIQEIMSKKKDFKHDLRNTIATMSYMKCYKYSMNKMEIYKELSDNFREITNITKNLYL
jgi:hypothetical protein